MAASSRLTVRPAEPRDADALGRMGAALVRLHHTFDPARFFVPPSDLEGGYRWWLSREMADPKAVVLVAEAEGDVVGYAYGRVEPRDWATLRDRCGELTDLWVEERARKSGAGEALCEGMVRAFAERGVGQVVLMAATANAGAQRLFTRLGWRPTMVEMTREMEPAPRKRRAPQRRKSGEGA